MNNVEYKNLSQYNERREETITQEIAQFVKEEGYSEDGFNAEGYDRRGFNRNGIDKDGFGQDGFNLHGINALGGQRDGSPSPFEVPFDKFGYDATGYDAEGYDKYGYNRKGYNLDGFNRIGEAENSDEVSINEYSIRSWETIPTEEIFVHDLYYSSIEEKMQTDATLKTQYYEQGKHPYSENAYNINLLCNTVPAVFDEVYPVIRVNALSSFKMNHPTYHNQTYRLQGTKGEILQIIDNEKWLPRNVESQFHKVQKLQIGDVIQLENSDGVLTDFKLASKEALSKEAQTYFNFANLALEESKGKWADASFRFDLLFYEAMDQQAASIKLSQPILEQLTEQRHQTWPENYLTDSNEEIEQFNREAREEFIASLLQDLQTYEENK
ncbi:MAG: hypothetical protein KBT36_06535 [Kurthia sp.]|nr:hypothetical protein [Candidatus Kurthia equi]